MAREPTPGSAAGEPLLTRLLRRRAEEPATNDAAKAAPAPAADTPAAHVVDDADPAAATGEAAMPTTGGTATPPARIDPESGRPIDELVDADLPPLDSIGPDSDVRAFLGRNISPELRRQALRKLFHQPKFNVICLCAEYAENYNNFTPMGAIVPHDLKRQLALQAERLAKRMLEQETTATGTAGAAADSSGGSDEPRAGGVLQRGTDDASTKVLSEADDLRPDPAHGAVDKPQRG